MATIPTLTLNNGVALPALGLGVFQSTPEETTDAVQSAINTGYRLIDTAASYQNEREVGEGIRRAGIPRSELSVTTKLWIGNHGYEEALVAFDASLRRLGLDYVDLYLLHWPVPTEFETTVQSWKALEAVLADGRARAIGVCNFSPIHLDALAEQTQIVPAVNQVELHPYFGQAALCAENEKRGIITQAWSPIGGALVYRRSGPDDVHNVLTDPVVAEIAEAHGKSPAQVLIRWHIQNGRSAIPKSVKPHRIAENFNVFGFALTAQELADIDALDRGFRGGPDPEVMNKSRYTKTIDNS